MDNTKELRACVIIYKGRELPNETRDKIVTKIIKDCNVTEQAELFILNPVDIAKTLVNSKIQFIKEEKKDKGDEVEAAVTYVITLFSSYINSRSYFKLALELLKNLKKSNFQTLRTSCEILSKNTDKAKNIIKNKYYYEEEVIDVIVETFKLI